MTEFLTTQGTAYHLENTIINANKWLILISPFLNITENFLQRLQDADKRKVKIIIIYGKSKLKPEEKKKLQELENLSLYYCRNLHAKCFLNEDCLIITSMNMYEFSEKTNREMGVLIRKSDDADQKVYEDAMREVKSILDSAQEENVSVQVKKRGTSTNKVNTTNVKVNLPASTKTGGWVKAGETLVSFINTISEKNKTAYESKQGYCIRCQKKISFDVDKPYCRECFSSWREWENPAHKEKYCHTCGQKNRSSMLYPQCSPCFHRSLKY